MNITALYSLFVLNYQSQYVPGDINMEIAKSLRYVIDNFFMKYGSSFVYVLSCPRQHTSNFFKDLMEILFSYDDTMKVQIVMNDFDSVPIGPGERIFNMIFIDDADSFIKLNPAAKVQNYDINEYYYVFLQNRDKFLSGDIQRILDYCWANHLINVDILVQRASGDLIIYSYFPFTPWYCGKVVPVEINRYRNGTMDSTVIFPEKLLDMNQCPLNIATYHLPPFVSLDVNKTGLDALGGFEGELLKTLAVKMNFGLNYVTPPKNEYNGKITKTEITGTARMLVNREADLGLGFFMFSINGAKKLTATDTYHQSKEVFTLLKDSPFYLTPELILYPYSTNIWMMLTSVFILTLVILKLFLWIARTSPISVSKVSGTKLIINFMALVLGMTSTLNPRSHFGRVFLATCLLSTLIIRAQYQALIFHLIRNNFFKSPPSTVTDLIQQQYTLVMNMHTYVTISNMNFFQEGQYHVRQLGSGSTNASFLYLEGHSDEKLVSVAPQEFLLYYGAINNKAGVFLTMKENIVVQSLSIYFTKHSFLVDRVNELVRRLTAAGMIQGWVNKALHLSYFSAKRDSTVGMIRQKQLKTVYYLYMVLVTLAIMVFLLELVSLRCEWLKKAFDSL